MAEETPATAHASPAQQQPSPPPARPARLPTALVTSELFLDHLTPQGFPEGPERLSQALALIEAKKESQPATLQGNRH